MADNGAVEKIKINGVEHNIAGIRLNSNGNREFYSEGMNTKSTPEPQKINVTSAGDIQIKTGDDSVLQFDCEANSATGATGDANEYQFKVCNGSLNKTKRVVGAKINVAEVILDTQNANTTDGAFDPNEIKIKYRKDKKEGGIYAKHMAGSFDFRCCTRDDRTPAEAHGGIAFQIAGKDNNGHENKIKFESNRTSSIDSSPGVYTGEGGDGFEFGTFNNEHSSLFSKDYRFNANAMIYPSTRTIEIKEGKTDYKTQDDDFKDIIDASRCATWGQVIDVASAADKNAIGHLNITGSGNVRIDSSGRYTYEAGIDAKDENGIDVLKGNKITSFVNEAYYKDSLKYCYTAKSGAKRSDGTTSVAKGKIILWSDASVYLASTSVAQIDSYIADETDENYYASNEKWKKTLFWEQNDSNVNIETKSKIKLQGDKLEILNEVNGAETKMTSVSISVGDFELNSTDSTIDASTIAFARKITKNGDETGHDPLITYTFTNNVYTLDSSTTFISNYKAEHPAPYPTDDELVAMYNGFVAQGPSTTYSVKLSTLLSLDARVYALEHPQA